MAGKISYKDSVVNGVNKIEAWIEKVRENHNNSVPLGVDLEALHTIIDEMNPVTYECIDSNCGVEGFTSDNGECPACHMTGKSKGRYAK